MVDMEGIVFDVLYDLFEKIQEAMNKIINEEKYDSPIKYDIFKDDKFTVMKSITYPATGRVVKTKKKFRIDVSVKITEE